MTVIFRRSETLELNLVEYRGAMTRSELRDIAKFQTDKPELLASDCLNLVSADADFSLIHFEALDALFEHYRMLFSPLRLEIFRRSAWLCQGEAAEAHVSHWLSRSLQEQMSSRVKLCYSFAEAADWLLLIDAERGLLERGEGFDELARFHAPPEQARAR